MKRPERRVGFSLSGASMYGTYISVFRDVSLSEAVAERDFQVAAVDFGFSYLKAGMKSVPYSTTEVEGVVLEPCADMPSHLETIPGSILAAHVIFAEYA